MEFHGIELEAVSDKFVLPKSKILITGGLGFIFSYVAEWFLLRGHDVHILDACRDGSHPRLMGSMINLGATLHRCDVIDVDEFMIQEEQYDYIIHAAAESNVDKSLSFPDEFYQSNIAGTAELLIWVKNKQKQLKQFLYINTDEVYGPTCHYPTPGAALNPSSPYAASKAAAGMVANCYRVTQEMPIREFRFCNVIGKRQADTKLIPRAIKCLKENKSFPLYDRGVATREYLDVRLVGLIIEHYWAANGIGSDRRSGSSHIQNITFNQERSINQVLAEISAIMLKKFITHDASRKAHDMSYTMRHAEFLDVLPRISFTQSLEWIINEEERRYDLTRILKT